VNLNDKKVLNYKQSSMRKTSKQNIMATNYKILDLITLKSIWT